LNKMRYAFGSSEPRELDIERIHLSISAMRQELRG